MRSRPDKGCFAARDGEDCTLEGPLRAGDLTPGDGDVDIESLVEGLGGVRGGIEGVNRLDSQPVIRLGRTSCATAAAATDEACDCDAASALLEGELRRIITANLDLFAVEETLEPLADDEVEPCDLSKAELCCGERGASESYIELVGDCAATSAVSSAALRKPSLDGTRFSFAAGLSTAEDAMAKSIGSCADSALLWPVAGPRRLVLGTAGVLSSSTGFTGSSKAGRSLSFNRTSRFTKLFARLRVPGSFDRVAAAPTARGSSLIMLEIHC